MLDRGPKKKRAAVKAVTEALAKVYNIPSRWVHVIIREITEEQIAVAGDLLCDFENKRAKRKKAEKKTGK
jgi:4-oxalocrotonate tautomerase family enzyme